MGGALVARHRETLRRLGQVEQVVRNPRPLRGRGFRGPHVHAPVHEHRVDRGDLEAERLGQAERRLGLAAGRGAHEGEQHGSS